MHLNVCIISTSTTVPDNQQLWSSDEGLTIVSILLFTLSTAILWFLSCDKCTDCKALFGQKHLLNINVNVNVSAESFWFSLFVAARDALPTQHVSISHPGNETQQSAVFMVRSGTAGTNPTDFTFNFNSLWILLIWCELQLALTTNVLQKEILWYSEYMPEPKLYYFTRGNKLDQYYFYTSTWTSPEGHTEDCILFWSFHWLKVCEALMVKNNSNRTTFIILHMREEKKPGCL